MKRQRGTGSIYLRGSTWWISYSRNGHQMRESANTTDQRKALKLLQQRLGEKDKPTGLSGRQRNGLRSTIWKQQSRRTTFVKIGVHGTRLSIV